MNNSDQTSHLVKLILAPSATDDRALNDRLAKVAMAKEIRTDSQEWLRNLLFNLAENSRRDALAEKARNK